MPAPETYTNNPQAYVPEVDHSQCVNCDMQYQGACFYGKPAEITEDLQEACLETGYLRVSDPDFCHRCAHAGIVDNDEYCSRAGRKTQLEDKQLCLSCSWRRDEAA